MRNNVSSDKYLRYPVHFIVPKSRIWPEFLQGKALQTERADLSRKKNDGPDCWVLRTAYELRLAGYPITLSSRAEPDAINIGWISHISWRNRSLTGFYLIPRADRHDPHLANFTVLQNSTSNASTPFASVFLWLQPGIIPRDPARGQNIHTLSYKGHPRNLAPEFYSDAFRAKLAAEGIELDLGGSDSDRSAPTNAMGWADYRQADLIMAIRNLTQYDALNKPASKLINAWWADVPALLGPEPAFREIATPGEHYIEIRKPDDVLAAIRNLRANPERYSLLIEAGRTLRQSYTDAATTARWIELLNGPVAEAYEAWQSRSRLSRIIAVTGMRFRDRRVRKEHSHRIASGPRILDE